MFISLRPIDIEFMKRLDEFVNIVPVIAKSDTMTLEERDAFKLRVCTYRMCIKKAFVIVCIDSSRFGISQYSYLSQCIWC